MSDQPLPLVVTGDLDLLDDLLRLVAAAGTEATVAHDLASARPSFATAPLVVIGLDHLEAFRRARLPRRPGVLIAGRHDPTDDEFADAERAGAAHFVALPEADSWLVDRFAGRSAPETRARLLAVIGGRGGAGASILAGGLAMTAARAGHRTLLLDADPLGGGLDLLLGWEQVDGLRWSALADANGRVDPAALLNALPHRGELVLLSFDREQLPAVPSEAMAATLDAGRAARDVIVADLPRQLDDAAVLALQTADRALLIVPAELRATAAAARVARAVQMHCGDVAVVVRGPAPGKLRAREVASALHLPLAGTLRPEAGLCREVEQGRPPAGGGKGSLAVLCRQLIDDLMREQVAA